MSRLICLVDMNMLARFDEIPAMTLQEFKETKPYGWTYTLTHADMNMFVRFDETPRY